MEPEIGTAAPADPKATEFLRNADPVMARLIDVHPDFRPRAWLDELPPLDAFGTLVFQVLGQQLSVTATRAILSRLVENFGGRLPSPAELLRADAQVLRGSGMSARKVATLWAIAERFVDGRLSEEVLAEMSDAEVDAVLTEVLISRIPFMFAVSRFLTFMPPLPQDDQGSHGRRAKDLLAA